MGVNLNTLNDFQNSISPLLDPNFDVRLQKQFLVTETHNGIHRWTWVDQPRTRIGRLVTAIWYRHRLDRVSIARTMAAHIDVANQNGNLNQLSSRDIQQLKTNLDIFEHKLLHKKPKQGFIAEFFFPTPVTDPNQRTKTVLENAIEQVRDVNGTENAEGFKLPPSLGRCPPVPSADMLRELNQAELNLKFVAVVGSGINNGGAQLLDENLAFQSRGGAFFTWLVHGHKVQCDKVAEIITIATAHQNYEEWSRKDFDNALKNIEYLENKFTRGDLNPERSKWIHTAFERAKAHLNDAKPSRVDQVRDMGVQFVSVHNPFSQATRSPSSTPVTPSSSESSDENFLSNFRLPSFPSSQHDLPPMPSTDAPPTTDTPVVTASRTPGDIWDDIKATFISPTASPLPPSKPEPIPSPRTGGDICDDIRDSITSFFSGNPLEPDSPKQDPAPPTDHSLEWPIYAPPLPSNNPFDLPEAFPQDGLDFDHDQYEIVEEEALPPPTPSIFGNLPPVFSTHQSNDAAQDESPTSSWSFPSLPNFPPLFSNATPAPTDVAPLPTTQEETDQDRAAPTPLPVPPDLEDKKTDFWNRHLGFKIWG